MSTKNIFIQSNGDKRYEIHAETSFLILRDISANRYLRIRRGRGEFLKRVHANRALPLCESMFASLSAGELGAETSVIQSHRWYDARLIECDGAALRKMVIPRAAFAIPVILFGIFAASIGVVGQMLYLEVGRSSLFLSALWLIINVVLHELGHALCCIACEREVASFGIKLNYGIPMMYVETSDICMANRIDRIRTSLAGVYVNGILLLGLFLMQGAEGEIIGNLGTISLALIWLNLIPFVKLDGYYILEDMLDEPGLAKAGLIEVKSIFHKQISECKGVLLIYGLCEVIFFTVIIYLLIVQFVKLINI